MGSESCRPNRGSRNGVCVGGWGEGSPPGAPPNPMGDPEAADSDSDPFSGRPPSDPLAVDPGGDKVNPVGGPLTPPGDPPPPWGSLQVVGFESAPLGDNGGRPRDDVLSARPARQVPS